MIATTFPDRCEAVRQRVGNRPAGVGGVRCASTSSVGLVESMALDEDQTGLRGAFVQQLAVLIPDEIAQHHGGR